MFTGIVAETGRVAEVSRTHQGIHLVIHAANTAADLKMGDSLAVNGCCLTAVSIGSADAEGRQAIGFDLLEQTWKLTNLHRVVQGTRVNLERPLSFQGGLDGHFVSGHVDGVAIIRQWEPRGADWYLEVEPPAEMMPLLVHKGSVALDGISLTVASVQEKTFSVWVIPHTREVTQLGDRGVDDLLNIETDLLGKYVDRLLKARGL